MPEKIEPQLDEIRRRARRRLVGAVVLALAAAVLVPMLLESDPKPLGEDVSVKIPPVDEGKFVSKLGEKAKSADGSPPAAIKPAPAAKSAAETPPATPSKDAGAANKTSAAESSTQPPAPPKPTIVPPIGAPAKESSAPAKEPSAPAKEPSAPSDASSATAAAPQESKPTPTPTPTPSPTPAPPPSPSPSPSAAPPPSASAKPPASPPPVPPAADASKASKPASGAFSVQLAAFADDKGANALVTRLKKAGHPAYTESFSSPRGIVWRVRVGPYGTREAAEVARTRLKADGQDGIIATSN